MGIPFHQEMYWNRRVIEGVVAGITCRESQTADALTVYVADSMDAAPTNSDYLDDAIFQRFFLELSGICFFIHIATFWALVPLCC